MYGRQGAGGVSQSDSGDGPGLEGRTSRAGTNLAKHPLRAREGGCIRSQAAVHPSRPSRAMRVAEALSARTTERRAQSSMLEARSSTPKPEARSSKREAQSSKLKLKLETRSLGSKLKAQQSKLKAQAQARSSCPGSKPKSTEQSSCSKLESQARSSKLELKLIARTQTLKLETKAQGSSNSNLEARKQSSRLRTPTRT